MPAAASVALWLQLVQSLCTDARSRTNWWLITGKRKTQDRRVWTGCLCLFIVLTADPVKALHSAILVWPYWFGHVMHPSGVAKSSTSFGWGKGGNVTSVGWQVTLCDLIWYVSSRSGEVKFTNCYIYVFFLYFTLLCSNPPFLIFDIRALWRSGLSARAPECQKLKMRV